MAHPRVFWQQIKTAALLQSFVVEGHNALIWCDMADRLHLGSDFAFWGSCLAMWGLVLNPKCRQQICERTMWCMKPKCGMTRVFASCNQDHYQKPPHSVEHKNQTRNESKKIDQKNVVLRFCLVNVFTQKQRSGCRGAKKNCVAGGHQIATFIMQFIHTMHLTIRKLQHHASLESTQCKRWIQAWHKPPS